MRETYTLEEFDDMGDGFHIVLVREDDNFHLEIEGAGESGWISAGETEIDLDKLLLDIGYKIVRDDRGMDE